MPKKSKSEPANQDDTRLSRLSGALASQTAPHLYERFRQAIPLFDSKEQWTGFIDNIYYYLFTISDDLVIQLDLGFVETENDVVAETDLKKQFENHVFGTEGRMYRVLHQVCSKDKEQSSWDELNLTVRQALCQLYERVALISWCYYILQTSGYAPPNVLKSLSEN